MWASTELTWLLSNKLLNNIVAQLSLDIQQAATLAQLISVRSGHWTETSVLHTYRLRIRSM